MPTYGFMMLVDGGWNGTVTPLHFIRCFKKIKVKGTKALFSYSSSDTATIPNELYNTHVKKQHFCCQ
jgi:hypothetical protein